MAGMRAGLLHPSWPMWVEGDRLWNALSDTQLTADEIINYEASQAVKGWVQVIHRVLAWTLAILLVGFGLNLRKWSVSRRSVVAGWAIFALVLAQFSLGVMTVVNSYGSIPLGYGVAHQLTALVLLCSLIYIIYQLRPAGRPGVVS